MAAVDLTDAIRKSIIDFAPSKKWLGKHDNCRLAALWLKPRYVLQGTMSTFMKHTVA
jgi:hypothetical protein